MVDSILAAFQMSINAETLLIVFIGAFYGTIIGALPGLGTVVALTMCLPFTLHMENVPAIALLLAVYCGSVFDLFPPCSLTHRAPRNPPPLEWTATRWPSAGRRGKPSGG